MNNKINDNDQSNYKQSENMFNDLYNNKPQQPINSQVDNNNNVTQVNNNFSFNQQENYVPPITKDSPLQDKVNFYYKKLLEFLKYDMSQFDRSELELYQSYIGKNYDKITTRPFNFAAFFFNSIYFYYRKMFLYGTILIAINVLLILFIKSTFLLTLLDIVVGALANKVYLTNASQQIKKIKTQNPHSNQEKLIKLCYVAGGTSKQKAITGIIVQVGAILIITFTMAVIGLGSDLTSIFNNVVNNGMNYIKNKDETGSNPASFNGLISYNTDIIIKDNFQLIVPETFSDKSDPYRYKYENYSGVGNFNSCKISFGAVQNYKDADVLIDQMIAYYKNNNAIKENPETINNINWYKFSEEGTFDKTYYYATKKNNNIYLITYEIGKDNDGSCENYRTQIINSIK